jgi:hypothetical protein
MLPAATAHFCRAGARGVILTQPMSHPPALPAGLATAAAAATVEGTAAAAEGEGQPAGDAAAAANSSNDTPGGAGGRGGAQTTGTADSRSGGSKQGGGAVKLRHFLGGPVGMPGGLPAVSSELTMPASPHSAYQRAVCCLASATLGF